MGRVIRIALFLLSLYYLFSTAVGIRRYVFVKRELCRVEKRCHALKEENTALRREALKLKSDKFYIEKVVRSELGWVRPDEVIYLLK